MPFRRRYTYADARACIDRSNGQIWKGGAGNPAARQAYSASGSGLGHEYMHRGYVPTFRAGNDLAVGTKVRHDARHSNMLAKSRTADRETSYHLAAALLNTTACQRHLGRLDNGDVQQHWLKKLTLPAGGMALFGYHPGSPERPRMITSGSINFRAVNGSLFIASVYPDGFAGSHDFDRDNYDLHKSFIA